MKFHSEILLSISIFWSLIDIDKNVASALSLPASSNSMKWSTLDGSPPMLFAHRGEKVLLPEHTIASYEVASILGADYVEPDLCMTKDHVFVCHHDLTLKAGTDVEDHPEFDHLKRKQTDGTFNWYIRDFTLAELKKLRVRQKSVGSRPQTFNGFFQIPTFQEYLNVIHRMTFQLNRTIGISPELKEVAFHNQYKNRTPHFMEDALLDILEQNGYSFDHKSKSSDSFNCHTEIQNAETRLMEIHTIPCPPVIVQSFEAPPLVYLHEKRKALDLLQLIGDDPYLLTMGAVKEISRYAKYISLWKFMLYQGARDYFISRYKIWDESKVEEMGGFIPTQNFTRVVHSLGLKVVIFTIYDSRESSWSKLMDNSSFSLSSSAKGSGSGLEGNVKTRELNYLLRMGIDGIFVENVAESREVLAQYAFNSKNKERLQCSSGSISNSIFAFSSHIILIAFSFMIKNSQGG